MDSLLKLTIKKTIKYGQKFGVRYGKEDIKERLISDRVFSDGEIEEGLEKSKIQSLNSKKTKHLIEKLKKAEELVRVLGKEFKDILMIGITGSVAAGYPKINDDIDLMIITKKNKLWLTRFRLRLFIAKQNIPHRKYGKLEEKDEFCFNLWLDETSLRLPSVKHNLNNAMDLILMKPVFNRNSTYEKFIKSNDWVGKFVASGYKKIKELNPPALRAPPPPPASGTVDKEGKALLVRILNWVMFWIQFFYMKKRISNETVDLNRAFFHQNKDSDRIRL